MVNDRLRSTLSVVYSRLKQLSSSAYCHLALYSISLATNQTISVVWLHDLDSTRAQVSAARALHVVTLDSVASCNAAPIYMHLTCLNWYVMIMEHAMILRRSVVVIHCNVIAASNEETRLNVHSVCRLQWIKIDVLCADLHHVL